jgi:hypothetical protein
MNLFISFIMDNRPYCVTHPPYSTPRPPPSKFLWPPTRYAVGVLYGSLHHRFRVDRQQRGDVWWNSCSEESIVSYWLIEFFVLFTKNSINYLFLLDFVNTPPIYPHLLVGRLTTVVVDAVVVSAQLIVTVVGTATLHSLEWENMIFPKKFPKSFNIFAI